MSQHLSNPSHVHSHSHGLRPCACSTRHCHECSTKMGPAKGQGAVHANQTHGWWDESGKRYFESGPWGVKLVTDLRSETEKAADAFAEVLLDDANLSLLPGDVPSHSHSVVNALERTT